MNFFISLPIHIYITIYFIRQIKWEIDLQITLITVFYHKNIVKFPYDYWLILIKIDLHQEYWNYKSYFLILQIIRSLKIDEGGSPFGDPRAESLEIPKGNFKKIL